MKKDELLIQKKKLKTRIIRDLVFIILGILFLAISILSAINSDNSNKNDIKSTVGIEFEMDCNEKSYNKDSLEMRYIVMNDKENSEKLKALYIAANKADISKKLKH